MSNALNTVTSAHDLSALLDWYEAVGADCALDDDPQDRFEESRQQALARQLARQKAQNQTSRNQLSRNPNAGPQSHAPAGGMPPHMAHAGPGGNAHPSASTFTSKAPSNQAQHMAKGGDLSSANWGLGGGLQSFGAGHVEEAKARAANAKTLMELRAALETFDACSLKFSAKSLVFGDGNPDADIMFIGEAPGRDEDLSGTPFVGRAGQLLDKMMAAIQLDRSNSYITNILPWRPPGNRKPSLDEAAMLRPFIHRHIQLVNPKLLVFLGGTAAQQLLDSKDGIMRLRGRWKAYNAANEGHQQHPIPAMATLHPAFLLRTPTQKRAAWQDLLQVAAKLDEFS